MRKLHIIHTIAILAMVLETSACSGASGQPTAAISPDPMRPNIILILTDDQPPQSVQYMPNVQKELAGKGISFMNAFVTTPLCCPSRASILTGLYAHNHGVETDRSPQGGATVFKDASTIAVWLKARGYRTALMGKYLNNYDSISPSGYVPPGWDEWDAFMAQGKNDGGYYYGYTMSENGKVVQYGTDAAAYSSDVLTAKALKFIQDSGNHPFFLMLNYYNPHQTYIAADRYKDMFKTDSEFKRYRPPNFLQSDLTGKPDWLKTLEKPEAAYLDHVYERILRSIMAVDDGTGKIVNTLDRLSERDRTAVFYMTDNGESLGDNNVLGKNCPYDACIHVPLIVSYPPLTAQARTDEHFVLNIDIAPTLAALAGAKIPGKVNGVSILRLLTDPATTWRDHFLFEHFQEAASPDEGLTTAIPTFSGVRSADWKYVEYETGERELYDLRADPYEMHNLAGLPGHEQIIATLKQELQELKKQ
ncbi:MAG: sulfatase-like hydrolase/transferase [Anaerolineales bacterium]